MSDMTEASFDAVTPGGAAGGSGLAGRAGTPGSRSVSASAMIGEGRAGYFAIGVGAGGVAAAADSAFAAATAAATRCSTSACV